jgi:cell wall-associated NlpC family hydrolase
MRHTTETRGRISRGAIALLLVISASAGFAGTSSASPSKQDVERAKARLDALNQRLSLLVEQYDQEQIELGEIQGKLAQARAAAKEAAERADRALADLNARAVRAYQGIGSELEMLLSAESLADFSDRLEFLGSMAQSDADLATKAQRAQQQSQWAAADLAAAEQEQRRALDRLRQKESEIRSGIADAKALYEELNRKWHEAVAAAAAAAAAAASYGSSVSPPPGGPPPAPNPNAQAAIDAAYSVIGTPYVFGAADPDVGFDCSGLTMWSWAHAGVSLPHSSAQQYAVLPHVSRSDLQPGDLVFFYTPISHVGMYINGSTMIDANHPGDVVNLRPINWSYFVGAARP